MKWLLILLLFASCAPNKTLVYDQRIEPSMPLDKKPTKVVLINAYDVAYYKYLDGKEKLFLDAIDTMLVSASNRIDEISGLPATVIKGYTPINSDVRDSIMNFLSKHNASHLLMITDFDAKFIQTHVNVERTESGKSREAHYDFIAKSEYRLFDLNGQIDRGKMDYRTEHSSRPVISGLLAAGPSITSAKNTKLLFEASKKQMQAYLNKFFPGYIPRSRMLYTTKQFKPVGEAINNNDFDKAFVLSLQLSKTDNRLQRSQALYNCAVLMERKGDAKQVESFLDEDEGARNLFELMGMR